MADRPADASRAVRALGSDGRRAALRLGVVPEVLHGLLLERAAAVGTSAGTTADTTADTTAGALDVLDVGGGTGGFAVPLAREGHRVTVVDPSPDALAALERRAAEAGVPVRAVQGDLSDLLDVVPAAGADVVLVHGALEHADDPAAALERVAAVLRPGGVLSVLAAQRLAAVIARALAGHFEEARHALADPAGRWGAGDPLPRRFDEADLVPLVTAAGFAVREVHGVRVFADLVPGALVDVEPGAAAALSALEAAAATHPVLAGIAAQLHVLAVRT